MKPTVIHMMDDATPGGVTRVAETLMGSKVLGQAANQEVHMVPARGGWPRFDADVIVSHLTINWRNLPALMALRAKHPQAVLIHVEHSYTQRFTALNVPKKSRFFTLLRTAYALFDHVICVSRMQESWMATRGLVAPHKVRVIRSAVDLSPFARLRPSAGPIRTLGLIGRLHEQKGFDLAIPAFRAVASEDMQLRIFGGGDEDTALRQLAGSDPRISFEGYAPDPVAAMAKVDAVLMPSRWEAYGLVAQEALAAGRPTLVAPVDGLVDQISDGATAISGVGLAALEHSLKGFLAGPAKAPVGDQSDFARQSLNRFENGWVTLLKEVCDVQNLAA